MTATPPSTSAENENALHAALALKKAGDYIGAIPAYEAALRRDPNLADAHNMLIYLYGATRTLEAGIAFFRTQLDARPDNVAFLCGLGILNSEAGNLALALQYFDRAVQIDPTQYGAWFNAACILMKQGQHAAANDMSHRCFAMQFTQEQRGQFALCGKDAWMLDQFSQAQIPASSPRDATGPRDDWERTAIAAMQTQLEQIDSPHPTAVFFHIDSGDRHPFLDAQPTNTNAVDYLGVLAQACQAALRANPQSRIVILTNKDSDVSSLNDLAQCVRLDVPAGQMMYSRQRAYRALVMSRRVKSPILLLDTDILLNRDFRAVFDGSFDVGLTSRQQPAYAAMPVNEGVMIGADGASDAMARFLNDSLTLYEWIAEQPFPLKVYGFDVRNWRGGQLALAALVNWTVPPYGAATREINGVRYRFLPCDDYNYTVTPKDEATLLAAKWAVHFKGKAAKALAAAYAAHMDPRR